MIVYRLSRRRYAGELSGKGAALFGNRWNSKGVEMIYCAESRALAMAEVVVHLTLATLPSDFVMTEIFVPDRIAVDTVSEKELPKDWNVFPHNPQTQKIGDAFVRQNEYCVLKVPSAVVKGDFNYLLNPFHKDFSKIKIQNLTDFPLDRRVFG